MNADTAFASRIRVHPCRYPCSSVSCRYGGGRLDVDPRPLRVAAEDGLDDQDLPVAVLEGREVGRVLSRAAALADVAVEVAEQVARAVRVALGVAARVVGVAAGVGVEQRRVLDQHFVRLVAAADPEPVRLLLVPGERAPAAVDLDPLPVLPAGADLRDDEG